MNTPSLTPDDNAIQTDLNTSATLSPTTDVDESIATTEATDKTVDDDSAATSVVTDSTTSVITSSGPTPGATGFSDESVDITEATRSISTGNAGTAIGWRLVTPADPCPVCWGCDTGC